MHIRSFHATDLSSVKSLISSIMNREYPVEEKAYQYRDLNNIAGAYGSLREKFLVAQEENEIIGTIGIIEDSGSTALLRRLFVHSSHRSRQIGSMLVDTALDFCKMNGYKRVVFRATSRMEAAIKLLQDKKGFVEKERFVFNDVEIVLLHYKIH